MAFNCCLEQTDTSSKTTKVNWLILKCLLELKQHTSSRFFYRLFSKLIFWKSQNRGSARLETQFLELKCPKCSQSWRSSPLGYYLQIGPLFYRLNLAWFRYGVRGKRHCVFQSLEFGLMRATKNSQSLVIHRTAKTRLEMTIFGGIVFQALKSWF